MEKSPKRSPKTLHSLLSLAGVTEKEQVKSLHGVRAVVSEREQAYQRAVSEIDQIDQKLQDLHQQAGKALVAQGNIQDLKVIRNYEQRLQAQRDQLKSILETQREDLTRARHYESRAESSVSAARIEKRKIESLMNAEAIKHVRVRLSQEEQELDENSSKKKK
ncbi:hypothetical protein JNK13_02255 [bacterium]|nr:hypothetical protein [bacterium]